MLGANDGIISTRSLIVGVAAAAASHRQGPNERLRRRHELKIAAHEVIGAFMSACIDFSRSCVDQWTIDVKNAEGPILVEGRAGLNSS